MNLNFAKRVCPICSKKLIVGDEESYYDFGCSEFYLISSYDYSMSQYFINDWVGRGYKVPHYMVTKEVDSWIQDTIIPPYWIRSDTDSLKSKIYKYTNGLKFPNDSNLLLEVPIINPSDYVSNKFADRIKKLVLFS